MSDEKLIITPEEAASLLIDGKEYVHNFIQQGLLFIGCDYDRKAAVAAFRKAKRVGIGGDICKGMGHPIAVFDDAGRLSFFEADMAKVEAFEARRNMTNHTDLPWVRSPHVVTGDRAAALVEFGGSGLFVARRTEDDEYDLVLLIPHGPGAESIVKAQADGDFVVKAANAHEKLVGAIRDVLLHADCPMEELSRALGRAKLVLGQLETDATPTGALGGVA